MRNLFALLLSLAVHAAIAAFVWRLAQGESAPGEHYQPFDLNLLVIEPAPPAPGVASAPPAAESTVAPEPEPPAPEPEPPPPPPEPETKPEPKPVPKAKPKEQPKEKPKEKPKAKKRKEKEKTKAPQPPVPPTGNSPPAPAQPLFNSGNGGNAPAIAAKPAANSSAVNHNSGNSAAVSANALSAYRQGLGKAIERHKPRRVRDKGKVVIAFTVQGDGSFANIRVRQSSGNPALDNAALQAVQNTARHQAPPGGQNLDVTVPIQFR